MSWDWGNAAGGAASGAGAGMALGPLGAAAGGVIGGVLGGLTGSNTPQYSDPYAGILAPQIASEMQSNVGQQEATATAGALRADANNAYRGISNNPDFSGNASVLTTAYDNAQTKAQKGIVGANVAGASLDLNTRQQGIHDAISEQSHDLSAFQTQAGIDMTPSPLTQIGLNAMGSLAGSLAGGSAQGGKGIADPAQHDTSGQLGAWGYPGMTQQFNAGTAADAFSQWNKSH